jgi:HSP20 family molecular chaperone IbpA
MNVIVEADPISTISASPDASVKAVPRNPIMPGSSAPGAAFSRGVPAASDWQPLVDIVECESEFVIGVELIGIERDQVRVILDGSILSIAAKRERERNDNN